MLTMDSNNRYEWLPVLHYEYEPRGVKQGVAYFWNEFDKWNEKRKDEHPEDRL